VYAGVGLNRRARKPTKRGAYKIRVEFYTKCRQKHVGNHPLAGRQVGPKTGGLCREVKNQKKGGGICCLQGEMA